MMLKVVFFFFSQSFKYITFPFGITAVKILAKIVALLNLV